MTAFENNFAHMTWFDHQKRFSWMWDLNVFPPECLNELLYSCPNLSSRTKVYPVSPCINLPFRECSLKLSWIVPYTRLLTLTAYPTLPTIFYMLYPTLLYLPYHIPPTYTTLSYPNLPIPFPTPPLILPCPSLPGSLLVVSFFWSRL